MVQQLQYQKQPQDVSESASYSLTSQQKSPECTASHYQSNKGVQWVDLQNISEDPMVIGEKVSKLVVGSLGLPDAVASGSVFNDPLSCVPGNLKGDQPLVRTSSTFINGDPTANHVDHFATALLAQQLPPLPKFSGESSDGKSEIKTFKSGWTSLRWLLMFVIGLFRPDL